MKMIAKQTLTSVGLSIALLGAGAAYAQVPQNAQRGPDTRIERMAEQLDLSSQQQSQIEEIFRSSKTQSEVDRNRLIQLKQTIRASESDFDAGAVQAAADEIGQITSRMTYQMAEAKYQVHELLTEEQRAKLEQHMAMREERGKRWHRGQRDRGMEESSGS